MKIVLYFWRTLAVVTVTAAVLTILLTFLNANLGISFLGPILALALVALWVAIVELIQVMRGPEKGSLFLDVLWHGHTVGVFCLIWRSALRKSLAERGLVSGRSPLPPPEPELS